MKKSMDNMVFGLHSVNETLKSDNDIDKIFIQSNLRSDSINEIVKEAKTRNIPLSIVPIEKLNRFTRKNHQGVVCFTSSVNYASLDNILDKAYSSGKDPFILILDKITDVRNFGAISRTAECAGVNGIIIPSRGSAQINADAVKTSSGALNYIPICREHNLKETITYLKESGITIIACSEKTEDMVYDADYNKPVAIIMGSEESGISQEYLKLSDQHVKIPMTGQVGSLNVSVATGVIVYEAIRQRG